MKIPPKVWKILGGLVAALVLVVLVVWIWVIPWVIASQVRKVYGGNVVIGGWWLGKSAGVSGVRLHEADSSASPVWVQVDRIETDLSFSGLLRGRFLPTKIRLLRPQVTMRIDKNGKLLTVPPLKSSGGDKKTSTAPLPTIEVEDATVTLAQEGRPEMVISNAGGQIFAKEGDEVLDFGADDPKWGKWSATGTIAGDFKSGSINLRNRSKLIVDKDKTSRLPFVPPIVWEQVAPSGPVGVEIVATIGKTVEVVPIVALQDATVGLTGLGITTEGTTGIIRVTGGKVMLEDLAGRTLDGTVQGGGSLDFAASPAKIDMLLNLDKIDVTKTPPSWQLAEAGVTGKLTGSAQLKIALKPTGPDLTGSAGNAVIEGGSIGGIEAKSLKLDMKAEGSDIQYESKATGSTTELIKPLRRLLTSALIAFQQPPAAPPAVPAPPAQAPEPVKKKPAFTLPKSISTEIELEDVDLVQILAKAASLGIHLPVPLAGRMSIKAKATIPLGTIRDIRSYVFHGQAMLKGASIARVDLGQVRAKVDLENGVLDLTDFQGHIIDHPAGSMNNPPAETAAILPDQPLPVGGFRGRLHAEIDPRGGLDAAFEANQLPAGELAAPAFVGPPPVSGLITLKLAAKVDLAHVDEPKAWDVSGHAESLRLTYKQSILDTFSTDLLVRDGRIKIPDLAAKLGGQPLTASLDAGLDKPYAFGGKLQVNNWDVPTLLALVPSAPSAESFAGKASVQASGQGTLLPLKIVTQGDGKLSGFRAGPVPLGDVPIRWVTQGDDILVSGVEAQPFGGTIAAQATIPARGDRPMTGSLTLKKVNTAILSAAVPNGALQMSGTADGQANFTVQTSATPPIEANFRLESPDLIVQGIPTQKAQATLRVQQGSAKFDLFAEGLGGKMKFTGDVPLGAIPPPPETEVSAALQAVGFRIGDVWPALGVRGAAAKVTGEAAVDINLLTHLDPVDLRARGIAEARNLHWGPGVPLGAFKGVITLSPENFAVEPISGDIFGGPVKGWIRGVVNGPGDLGREVDFEVDADRVSLPRSLAILPTISKHVEGTGNLRLAGRIATGIRASGQLEVAQSRIYGFPLTALHAPLDFQMAPGGIGGLDVRHWSARFAGGRINGTARVGIGRNSTFHAENNLVAIDLESILRILTDSKKPASGRISGIVTAGGPDPGQLDKLHGRVDLDLDDASLFELPVFRELERFLGAARGGTFEDGDIHAAIVGKHLQVESFTLEGRLLQLHGAGTVGFDTRLDLEILVNTNQIIAQTGQSLLEIIPGLGGGGRTSPGVLSRFANFLANRLLKFKVRGTFANPTVTLDPSIGVGEGAAGFFARALKLP